MAGENGRDKKEGEAKKKSKRPTALKRDMQSEKRRLQNKAYKAKVGTAIRDLHESVAKGEKTGLKEKLSSVYSLMDKGVKNGIFKQNKASRIKARFSKRVSA